MKAIEKSVAICALCLMIWYDAPPPKGEAPIAVLPAPQLMVASFYDEPQLLVSGKPYDPLALTAAHRTLPLGTRVKVTDAATGRSVVVTINDRGPEAWTGRDIDLSLGAARLLQMQERGLILATIAPADLP